MTATKHQDHQHIRLPEVEPLPPISPIERVARGDAARMRVPLGRHGEWSVGSYRGDPIAILERQAELRDPDLVPIRHVRMAASPFAFFRGGAAIMAADLATTPVSGLRSQLCGDAHLLNFGVYDTPERAHVFDINDFDETIDGPWEWDVKRLAASIEIAGRDLGFPRSERRGAVTAAVREYREQMRRFADMGNLEVFYSRLDASEVVSRLEGGSEDSKARALRRDIGKGLKKGHIKAVETFIERDGPDLRFISSPPLVVPVEELLDHDGRSRYVDVIRTFLRRYRGSLSADRQHLLDGYRFVHMARKVVGVGSVGTRAWAVLLIGRDETDPLVLQLKEAQRSVLEPYAGAHSAKESGRRVVEGQRLMQAASDPLLGWYRLRALDGRRHDFYVRQMWDGKASIDVRHLNANGLAAYGAICGWTLARAHARSGPRISIASYLGDDDEFDEALADFAEKYADVNEQDHASLLSALESGRLEAATEG